MGSLRSLRLTTQMESDCHRADRKGGIQPQGTQRAQGPPPLAGARSHGPIGADGAVRLGSHSTGSSVRRIRRAPIRQAQGLRHRRQRPPRSQLRSDKAGSFASWRLCARQDCPLCLVVQRIGDRSGPGMESDNLTTKHQGTKPDSPGREPDFLSSTLSLPIRVIREIRGGSNANGGHPGLFTGGNRENGGRCHHETRETHEKWAAGF